MEYPAVFLKPEIKSLGKKHLTPEVFERYKNKKTSRGFTVLDCVKCAIEIPESQIGSYACDEECYKEFGDFYDKLVEDYHAPYKLTDGHKSDMDPSHLRCPNPDPEGKYIRSTRVRVARNLKGHALAPSLGKQERLDIEKKVVDVLLSLTGDLAGKYYPLQGMDEATREKLVEDHFLFKKGDRFLEVAGCNREWPEGRGIFHNDAKTFLVWINEEDQLRIISMEKGSDIGSVFKRLCTAVNTLDAKLGFQYSDSLGYLSSCPSNLGTGMRASVHIKIPNAYDHPDFKAVCDQYHIQPRGVHGEDSESTGEDAGVYDISNRRRLGLSEVQCVQDMYDGIMKLLEMEKAAQK